MKKNIILLILAVFLLISCSPSGDGETKASADNTPNGSETVSNSEDLTDDGSEAGEETLPSATEVGEDEVYYTVELDDGTVIPLGKIADGTIASLGEASSVTEAPSCVYDGMDRLYNYGAFTVTTSPDADGNDRISELSFNSDAVSLKNGVSIGSSRAKVESVFGNDYTELFGVLKFELEGAEISIVLDDDDCVLALTFAKK